MDIQANRCSVIALAALAFVAHGSVDAGPQTTFSDRVVSDVAGQPILWSELRDRTQAVLKGLGEKPPVVGRPLGAAQSKILRASLQELEHEVLVDGEAHRLRVSVTDSEIDRAIDQVAAGNGITRADLIARLPQSGMTEQSYRASLKSQILRMKLFNIQRAGLRESLTDGDEVAFAQAQWLAELAKRSPVVRHLEVGDSQPPPQSKPRPGGVCDGAAGLPTHRWRLQAWPPPLATGRIASLRYEGLPDPLPGQLVAMLRVRAGQPVDPVEVQGDLIRLWETGGYADLSVRAEQTRAGLTMTYSVVERPRVGGVKVYAGDALRESVVQGTLALVEGQPLRPARIRAGKERLRALLDDEGYIEAVVEVRHRLAGPGRVDLCVSIQPGPRYEHVGARFEGNQVLTGDILHACMGHQPGQRLRADPWMAQRLSACAYDRGLINARISGPTAEIDHQAKTIGQLFTIDEGKVYRLGSLDVSGDLIAAEEVYRSRLRLKAGEVFSRSLLRQAMQRITDMHAAYGRNDLDVIPVTNIDTDAGRIGITLKVQKR